MLSMQPEDRGVEKPEAKPAPDKGDEKRFASFGEQLMAVYRAAAPGGRTDERLSTRAALGANETTPSDGGFLVQQDDYEFRELIRSSTLPCFTTNLATDLYDVLEVYTPEIVRYLFVGTRPSAEFAISFDLDVLKIYEDYDNCERIYFGLMDVKEQRREKERRIYELSQVDSANIPTEPGYQVPFRHLCNLLQIHEGNIEKVMASLCDVTEGQKARLEARLKCAWNWIEKYAPEEFRWSLRKADDELISVSDNERKALRDLSSYVSDYLDTMSEKDFSQYIYKAAADNGMENADFFTLTYRVLINKEKGPKLAGFIKTVGKDKIVGILSRY